MMFYISMKFHETILNGCEVIERQFCYRQVDRRTDGQTTKAKTTCLRPFEVGVCACVCLGGGGGGG